MEQLARSVVHGIQQVRSIEPSFEKLVGADEVRERDIAGKRKKKGNGTKT